MPEAPELQDASPPAAPEPPAPEEFGDAERDALIAELEAEERGEEPASKEPTATASASANPPADAGGEVEAAPADAAPAQAAPADADPAFTDPWADVPEAARAAFAKAERDRKSAEGRLAAADRRLAELTAAPRESARTEPEPQGEGARAADEAFSKFSEDYPDVAEPVKAMFDTLKGEIASLRTEKDAMERSVRTLGEDRLSTVYAEQEAQVLAAHPDFAEIGASEPNESSRDFVAWYEGQPQFVRQAVEANAETVREADAVNLLLNMYKRDRGITREPDAAPNADEARRNLQLQGARGAPRPSAGARAPEGGRDRVETHDDVRRELEGEERRLMAAAAA